MRKVLLLSSALILNGCYTGTQEFPPPEKPTKWESTEKSDDIIHHVSEPTVLKNWWMRFDDETLNTLVDMAMQNSPDRLVAEARIEQARGVRRTSLSALFPQLSTSVSGGRQDTGFEGVNSVDNLYDGGFDASYEIDIFGKNRSTLSAAEAELYAAEQSYQDTTLTLIADITRSYIDYRNAQKQGAIVEKNLGIQERTLRIAEDLFRLGEGPKLDVDRAENLVSTTKAAIPDFQRQAENAKLRLSILIGLIPEKLNHVFNTPGDIPGADVKPVLMTPAHVLAQRPDVKAAFATLKANTERAEAATAEFFPTLTLAGFYGISDGAFVRNATIWNVVAGAAVALLDFGRIEGQIDAARAREKEAYELSRKTILNAVVDVEMALNDYSHIRKQRDALSQAYESSQ
ncbi:MAG: TolC family protein, partial [Pseudomonadota bacterium]